MPIAGDEDGHGIMGVYTDDDNRLILVYIIYLIYHPRDEHDLKFKKYRKLVN